ncbi:hypothetical protein LOK74_08175 [Brevibacillus humidisoli]|uniref:hypothetical protein n=1 Tax=Brevibacillus humidisoli TaxID=2895522 RepID=UPI001E5D5EAF|nr:hypothetical protein [Brevibacillus humidisoli]UFJ42451.1 hypothetical protein LOK74_08175 [Brevibacillus humidisoli]
MCAASLLGIKGWNRPERLFLSIVGMHVPSTHEGSSPRTHPSDDRHNNPLHWLYEDNRQSGRTSREVQSIQGTNLGERIPVYSGGSHSDLALELLDSKRDQLPLPEIDLFLYAHESVEASDSVLPALKIRNILGMRRCLPFSLGFQGSLASLSAMEIADAFIRVESVRRLLLVTVDCIVPPFPRSVHSGYPKGDSAAGILLASGCGDYQVAGYRIMPHCLPKPVQQWDVSDYEEAEQQLIQLAAALIDELTGGTPRPDWLVVQSVSAAFTAALCQMADSFNITVKLRQGWEQVNLLGSDPIVTLRQMEELGEVWDGQWIVMLWASIDHGLGAVLLRKTEQASSAVLEENGG